MYTIARRERESARAREKGKSMRPTAPVLRVLFVEPSARDMQVTVFCVWARILFDVYIS